MEQFFTKQLTQNEYKEWDDFLDRSQHGTIFHKSYWLKACQDEFKNPFKIYGCFKNNILCGGCSYYEKQELFKIAYSLCTMTPYGGFVLENLDPNKVREGESTQNKIINSLITQINFNKYDYICMINSPEFIDVRPFIFKDWEVDVKYTYYLNLKDDIDKTISKNALKNVKRALKNNIVIEKYNSSDTFYNLYVKTFQRQNLEPYASKTFFKNILDLLQTYGDGEMWVAKTENAEIIAADIIIWDKNRAYRWAAASDPEFKNTACTSLLLYTLFKEFKKRGFDSINLMTANTPHLSKFTSGFNPQLIPYYSLIDENNKFKFSLKFSQKLKKIIQNRSSKN